MGDVSRPSGTSRFGRGQRPPGSPSACSGSRTGGVHEAHAELEGHSCFGSGAKIEPMVGAQERWSHATACPCRRAPPRAARPRWCGSTVVDSSSRSKPASPGAADLAAAQSRLDHVIRLRLAPNPPPSSVTFTVTLSSGRLRAFISRSLAPAGPCVEAQASQTPSFTRATAAGASIGAWTRWARSTRPRPSSLALAIARIDIALRAHDLAGLARRRLQLLAEGVGVVGGVWGRRPR